MIKYLEKKKVFILYAFAGLVLGGILVFSLWLEPGKRWFPIRQADETALRGYAANIIKHCSAATYRPGCYDEEIPKLMSILSIEQAFEVTRFVQQEDGDYFYCHVLGHKLATEETKKDPAEWKEVVRRCPVGMCSNGCLHGAFQERFRAEALPNASILELKKELEGVCVERVGWNPTGLERGTCYHALGHLLMYITNAGVDKSLTLCGDLTREDRAEDYTPLCYDGAFMQIFQPLEPEDFALAEGKAPSKDKLQSFCKKYQGHQLASCWSEGWPLFSNEIKFSSGLIRFCSFLDPAYQPSCFNDLFYVLAAVEFNLDASRIRDFCSGFPPEWRGSCFASSASRMIETDYHLIGRSVALCQDAEGFGVGDNCYSELLSYSRYNFHRDTDEFFRLCNSLTEPWRTKCLAP